MKKPHKDTTEPSLTHQQRDNRTLQGTKRWGGLFTTSVVVIVALAICCGLALSGCGGVLSIDGKAEAQDGTGNGSNGSGGAEVFGGTGKRLVETLRVTVGTFVLATDSPPRVRVLDDGVTIYEIGAGGGTVNLGGEEVDLDNGDSIVERPRDSSVTLNRRQ